jgi:hypothetical protein
MAPVDSVTIRMLIARFLAADEPKSVWAKPAVEKHGFMPLYFGWTATLGVRPDGSFVRWNHEDGLDSIEPCTTPFLQRMALAQAAKKYAELAAFVPARPPEGVVCPRCGGSGRLPGGAAHIICVCGGLGWTVPGEDQGVTPG